jgi:AAA ATPase domain
MARFGLGHCIQQYGAGEPYMPVLEALSRLGREPGGERVTELLRKFAPTWLAQMPSLLDDVETERLQKAAQGVTQQRMLREMADGLEALAAESPLVLVLEELHWSDFSTLELISAIARRSEPARLLVVGTYRPVEMLAPEHPLRTMKQELELHR